MQLVEYYARLGLVLNNKTDQLLQSTEIKKAKSLF
jgi:hypothetical protein